MTWDTYTLTLAQDSSEDRPISQDSADTDARELQDSNLSGPDGAPPPPVRDTSGMWIWLLLPVMLIMIMMSSGRKEKKKRAQLLAALSKGDKVQTTGGILGTVVEVRDDEIVVKVDENANTRLRFSRNAILSILESKNAD